MKKRQRTTQRILPCIWNSTLQSISFRIHHMFNNHQLTGKLVAFIHNNSQVYYTLIFKHLKMLAIIMIMHHRKVDTAWK